MTPPQVSGLRGGEPAPPGASPERPFRITLPLVAASFADQLFAVKTAAAIASNFSHSEAHLLSQAIMPYTADILELYPFPGIIRWFESPRDWYPIRFYDGVGGVQQQQQSDGENWPEQDFILPPMMASQVTLRGPEDCPLVLPEAWHDDLDAQLQRLGLDPNHWFCCLHYREPTYTHKQVSNIRDVNPDNYLAVRDHVISELGGQVIRLGHPEMAPWPDREGFVDLSRLPASWRLQFRAMSQARFFIGSGSGATGIAVAFNIPSAHTDIGDFYTGRAEDILLTYEVVSPDGRRLMQQDLFDSGLFSVFDLQSNIRAGAPYRIRRNNIEELTTAARQIHARTADISGWRTPAEPKITGRNSFLWPPQSKIRPNFVDLSALYGAQEGTP